MSNRLIINLAYIDRLTNTRASRLIANSDCKDRFTNSLTQLVRASKLIAKSGCKGRLTNAQLVRTSRLIINSACKTRLTNTQLVKKRFTTKENTHALRGRIILHSVSMQKSLTQNSIGLTMSLISDSNSCSSNTHIRLYMKHIKINCYLRIVIARR